MKRKFLAWLLLIALMVAALVAWRTRPGTERSHLKGSIAAASPAPALATAPKASSITATGAPQTPALTTGAKLDDLLARLQSAKDPASARKLLLELRSLLEALPHDVASHEVQEFLASGRDAATKLDLTLQAGGALGDASSMRVFLLDYLGRIDHAAGAAAARQILSAPTSPDEWAISLRNVAWAGNSPADLAYLRAKARELISNPDWREKASAGYLEAFDVIVHARGFDLAPQLADFVRDRDHHAVAHAAYLTLDRLTIADPVAALGQIAAQPQLMEGREQTRANFFARGDVRDPQQKSLLESYLLDSHRTPQELQTFAGLFPNANYMISNNLLTGTATPTHDELTARDRASLATVETWLADPRFAKLRPQLSITRDRLRTFVQQAAAK